MFFRDKKTLTAEQNDSRRASTVTKHSMKPAAVGESMDENLQQQIIAAIRQVYDPEIHINIYDLGLIYDLRINEQNEVDIDMTLTAPACPVAEILPEQVAAAVKSVDGVTDVRIKLVWEPPWSQDCISDAARLELGLL